LTWKAIVGGPVDEGIDDGTSMSRPSDKVPEAFAPATDSSIPPGVRLGELSLEVMHLLGKYTGFAWAILQVQCKRRGVDPTALGADDLRRIADDLAASVQRYSSPAEAEQARAELKVLVRRHRVEGDSSTPPRAREHRPSISPARPGSTTGDRECPKCGRVFPRNKICWTCGVTLSDAARCPRCGSDAQRKRCPDCGVSLRPRG
jgi:hypothetical protein